MSRTIDLEALLAPISEESPAGADLREDPDPTGPYTVLKMARRAARDEERKEQAGDASARPDWAPILSIAPETLASRSKDFEVAVWLLEALLRRHGFAGLRDGFELLHGLVERYWDTLHPLPDGEDYGDRTALLAGLNGSDGVDGPLILPINRVPLTGSTEDGEGYARWQYIQAANLESITDLDKRQARIDSGHVPEDRIRAAESSTPESFFRERLGEVDECLDAFEKLCAVLDEKCGSLDSPPSSNIRNALRDCRSIVQANIPEEIETVDEDESSVERGGPAAGGAAPAPAGAIRTREDAFKELLRVADFFKKTEPHSPVAYALERAVRWGKMPLPELLQELIREDSSRSEVFKLVGIQPPQESYE